MRMLERWAMLPENEERLLQRCREGDPRAFTELVQRYRHRIVNLAFQLLGDPQEAEDVAQETFVQAYLHLASFRGESQLFTWLYRITVNACRRRLRKYHPQRLPENWEPLPEPDWGELEAKLDLKTRVDHTLQQLSEPLRLVLILREMHELSYEEIAQVLEVPLGTVRSRLFEARRQFAQIWRFQAEDER